MHIATGVCNYLGSDGLWEMDWNAISAIATALAVIVALVVPARMAKKEWKRQDFIREAEWQRQDELRISDAAISARSKEVINQEVCSAVDQILAYYEVTLNLAKLAAPFLTAFDSFERVHENTKTLLNVLEILVDRTELSDGAVFIGVAVERVGATVVENSREPRAEGAWPNRVVRLEKVEALAKIIGTRSRAVRENLGVRPSRSAEMIRRKYLPLVEEMERALAEERPPIQWDLNSNHF